MSKTFFGSWSDLEGMRSDFSGYGRESPVPEDIDVVFASYGQGSYCGEAVVVFRKDGELFETHGSHCSCYGLEGMWDPEPATVASLKETVTREVCANYSDHDNEAKLAWGRILAELEQANSPLDSAGAN